MNNLAKRRVIFFVIFLIPLTALSHFLSSANLNQNLQSLLIMWTPGIAAIIAGLFTHRSLKKIGWSFSIKWISAGWAIPIIYGFIAYGAVWATGLGGVPNPTFLERARLTLGMSSESDLLIIISAFLYITVVNLIPAMVMSMGEEIGWRGFLVPELTDWIGFKKASWLSGIIWGLWHLPGILSGAYSATGTPLAYQLFCFILMVISTGVILAWLRMKSKSIWPAAIFHATHNGAIQMFFDRITFDTGHTAYFIGEFGLALVPVIMVIAWLALQRSAELRVSAIH